MQMYSVVHQLDDDIRALQQRRNRSGLTVVDRPHRIEQVGRDPRPAEIAALVWS